MDNQIFELINNLSSLTTFEVSFLKDDYTFIGQDSFFNYLRQKLSYEVQHLTKLLIFPFISNDRLKGYFLVKSNKPFIKEQVNLIRLMLKSAFISAFDQQLRINVLYPLTDQKLKDFLFILKNSNISKGGGSTPPPRKYVQLPTKAITNIANALSYINHNVSKSLSLDSVSKAIYISPAYLSRQFKDILNIRFIDYINISKMNAAQEKLIMTKVPIIELSNNLGFSQASYFTKTFKKWTKLTPSEYRNKNRNVKQVYTVPRTADWTENANVFDVSKKFFIEKHFSIKTKKFESNNFIYSINGLRENQNRKNGWVYTVDCKQPSIPSNQFKVKNKSVIQWLYISNS